MNEQQISKIKELSEQGKTQIEIAKELKTSQRVISYWLSSNEQRKALSKKSIDSFRRLTLDQRRIVYKRRLPYLRKYNKTRYHADEKFRDKMKLKTKSYYEKKKVKK